MFPVAILVATTAMASGVGDAMFFAPILLLALGLPMEIAVGSGLITEVFGFASGIVAYARKGWIDYRLGASLLFVTIPAAPIRSWLASIVNADALKMVLGNGTVGRWTQLSENAGREALAENGRTMPWRR